jgi:hypothetical protein
VLTFVKRLVVGRPLASSEQEHQRLPKWIALSTFSSDAISSTAYATEEILFVIAAGGSSLALGLNHLIPIATAVAILLFLVVFSYRQTIFAYPGGGGGRLAAGRLHPHRRRVHQLRRGGHHLDPPLPWPRRRTGAAVPGARRHGHPRQPAGHEGVREAVRLPDLRLHRPPHRAAGHRPVPRLLRPPRADPLRPREGRPHRPGRWHPQPLLPAPWLLVGCGRPDRRRGHLRRRARVPRASGAQRGEDAHADGVHPRRALLLHVGPRSPPAPPAVRARDGDLADVARGAGQRHLLLGPSVRHHRHPGPRRQHRLRRLPEALVNHRP